MTRDARKSLNDKLAAANLRVAELSTWVDRWRTLVTRIQDALDTAATGDELVQVARNTHEASLEPLKECSCLTNVGTVPIEFVTHGMIQQEEEGEWEPAILMLEKPESMVVVTGVLIRTGTVLTTFYDYRREDYRGFFPVSNAYTEA